MHAFVRVCAFVAEWPGRVVTVQRLRRWTNTTWRRTCVHLMKPMVVRRHTPSEWVLIFGSTTGHLQEKQSRIGQWKITAYRNIYCILVFTVEFRCGLKCISAAIRFAVGKSIPFYPWQVQHLLGRYSICSSPTPGIKRVKSPFTPGYCRHL